MTSRVLTNANGLGGTPAWIQLQPGGTLPSGRYQTQAIYDQKNNRMMIFGGNVVGNVPANDFWVLTNANGLDSAPPAWININPSGNIPTARSGDSFSYDLVHNEAVLFGGTLLNDLWTLSNADGLGQPGWNELMNNGSAGAIPPRDGVDTTYDTVNSRLTAFGGCVGSGTCVPANNVWVLRNANGTSGSPTWTQLAPAGTLPEPRFWYAATYDQTSNRMTVFGGADDPSIFLNDVWVLTNANGLGSSQLGITELLPNHGGNAGTVTATVIGSGLESGATIKLTGVGADILGANINVSNPSAVSVAFNLSGATKGLRNLVVTNPDNSSITLAGAFTVDQGGTPNIQVDILGRDKIRIGSPQTYYIQLTNSGNVDSGQGLVSLNIPADLGYTQFGGNGLYVAGTTPTILSPNALALPSSRLRPHFLLGAPSLSTPQNFNLLLATSGVTAGSTQYAPVEFLDVSVSDFTLTAQWQQDQYPSSFDEYLAEHSMGYFPLVSLQSSLPTQCTSQLQALTTAYEQARPAYDAFQNAWQTAIFDLAVIPLSVGKAAGEAAAVEGAGLPILGTIAWLL